MISLEYDRHFQWNHGRHIGIPKGILHYIALTILHRKSTSGSELMDEIEYYTDWRPSPGSMYPLLSRLEAQGLIELVKSEDPMLKRYALTSSGKGAIEEFRKQEPIRSRYGSIQKIYWKLCKCMDEDLFEAYLGLLKAIEDAHPLLEKNPEAVLKIKDLLKATSEKVEVINEQLKRSE